MKLEDLLYRMYTGTGMSLEEAMKEANESYNLGFYHNVKDGYYVADIQSEALHVNGKYNYIIKAVWKKERNSTVSSISAETNTDNDFIDLTKGTLLSKGIANAYAYLTRKYHYSHAETIQVMRDAFELALQDNVLHHLAENIKLK